MCPSPNIVAKCRSTMNVPQCSTAQRRVPRLVQLGFYIFGDASGQNWLLWQFSVFWSWASRLIDFPSFSGQSPWLPASSSPVKQQRLLYSCVSHPVDGTTILPVAQVKSRMYPVLLLPPCFILSLRIFWLEFLHILQNKPRPHIVCSLSYCGPFHTTLCSLYSKL